MKFLTTCLLLLALQLCAPHAQGGRQAKGGQTADAGATRETAPPPTAATAATPSDEVAAPADATDAARTVVCIDPGHPSEVASGMTMQHGTNETRVAWQVALKLKEQLEADGYAVVMTKSAEDELVRNRDRAVVANRARASLMVRLHCDASVARGFAVYYPDRRGKTRDGAAAGPSAEVIDGSRRAARAIHSAMADALKGVLDDNGLRTDYQTKVGREQGGALTGSIYSEVPVVTVEMVVLSDERDAEFIKREEGRRRMAEAIAEGVRRFVPPAATRKR